MDGILLVDKPKGITSRDVVNKVCKIFNTKKVGHTGTLDPLATGVLVLCIGKYTKLVDLITGYEKEYIATVLIGVKTDTLDITGNIISKKELLITKEKIEETLKSFLGKYKQEVPIYSAIKINGKKLYEYARNNEKVNLPKREVEIKSIELLNYNSKEISFKVTVSKGTYIRSLINDIGNKLNTPMCMKELRRIRQGNFELKDCYTIKEIESNKYKLLDIKDILNYKIVKIDNENLKFKILNGSIIPNNYNEEIIMFELNERIVAIYKIYDKNTKLMKPFKMFL